MNQNPEQIARDNIDQQLLLCGWVIQDKKQTYPIPIAPIGEQSLIVQELESRLSVCDKMEETISTSLQQAEALRQSILKKAFEGKLVNNE